MKLLAAALIDDLGARAAASARGRAHHNVHAGDADPVQRFFVAANRTSYFRPHRHRAKSEMALVLKGGFDVLTFDDGGEVTARYVVGEGGPSMGFEIPSGTWHTLIARTDGSTFLEVKAGPYDPATAAEYAPWAPPEGDPAVPAYLERLRHGSSVPASPHRSRP